MNVNEDNKNLTDSQKLDVIDKRLRRIELMNLIRVSIVVLGLLGVVGVLKDDLNKIKMKLK